MSDPNVVLVQAIQMLAGVCDGAFKHDNQGFNAYDTNFGHNLAVLPKERWSPKVQRIAWKMARKYRGQLQNAGIKFESIPEPPEPHTIVPKTKAEAKHRGSPKLVSIHEGQFAIEYPYNPKWNEELKQTVGIARFNREPRPMWTIPINADSVRGMRKFVAKKGFAATDGVRELADKTLVLAVERTNLSSAHDADIKVKRLKGTLMPFQKAGIKYAVEVKKLFIADQMGLGKTIQALAAMEYQEAYPALVVCPKAVKLNWLRELNKWIPHRRVEVIDWKSGVPKQKKKRKIEILVMNYDILDKFKKKLNKRYPFKTIIFDEAHKLKNPKAKRTIVAKEMAPDVPNIYMLSGTPILNRPFEIVTQLEILDRLKDLGGRWPFIKRYCEVVMTKFGPTFKGGQNLRELHDRMRSLCYVRRLKIDVLTELPEKLPATMVPLELADRKRYEAVEKDLTYWLMERQLAKGEKKTKKELDAERSAQGEQLVRIEALKQVAAQEKLPAVYEWVGNFLESEEKLVIYAHHQEIQESIASEFPGCARIAAGMSEQQRQDEQDRFNDDPKCVLMVASLMAGSEGINLQKSCSNVAFVELGWNPAIHEQAESRLHRHGQKDAVNCWYLLAERTIDMDIAELIESKREVIDQVTDGTEGKREVGILNALVDRLLHPAKSSLKKQK